MEGKQGPFFCLCDGNCVGTSTCQPATMTTKVEQRDSETEKKGKNSEKKRIKLSNSFPSLNNQISENYSKKQVYATKPQTY